MVRPFFNVIFITYFPLFEFGLSARNRNSQKINQLFYIPERLKEKFGLVHIDSGIGVPSFILIVKKVNKYCPNKRAGCQSFFLFAT